MGGRTRVDLGLMSTGRSTGDSAFRVSVAEDQSDSRSEIQWQTFRAVEGRVPDCGRAPAHPFGPKCWSFGPRKSAKRSPIPCSLGGSKGLKVLRFRALVLVGEEACIPSHGGSQGFKIPHLHHRMTFVTMGFYPPAQPNTYNDRTAGLEVRSQAASNP